MVFCQNRSFLRHNEEQTEKTITFGFMESKLFFKVKDVNKQKRQTICSDGSTVHQQHTKGQLSH